MKREFWDTEKGMTWFNICIAICGGVRNGVPITPVSSASVFGDRGLPGIPVPYCRGTQSWGRTLNIYPHSGFKTVVCFDKVARATHLDAMGLDLCLFLCWGSRAGQGRAGIVIQVDAITAEQEHRARGGLHTAEDHRSPGPFPWALSVSDNLFTQEKHLVPRDRAQWWACGG